MQVTRLRLILAAGLLLIAAGGTFAYFKYRKISNYLINQIGGQTAKKLGREVKFKSVSFSPLSGVVIKEACVSRRPDFSKGNFFCAAKTLVRPQLAAMLRNQVYFSKISFEKPVLKVREKNGAWDFADLLALLPETDKELYLTWNASELVMTDAVLEADLETSGMSVALENADLTLKHYSSLGGNYGLSAGGLVKTVMKGKLLTAEVNLLTETNFDYGGVASAKGSFAAKKISYGAMTLENLRTNWSLFNIRKPLADRNYAVSLTAEKLFIPGQETSIKDGVSKGLALFSAAMGKAAPKIEDIEMSALSAAFRLNDSALTFRNLALRTNFMDLDAGLAIDGPARTAEASLDAAIGPNRIKMSASGPIRSPRLKPTLSDTLSGKFKEALLKIETGLLKTFPVTGE